MRAILIAAAILLLPLAARAYERPNAFSLTGMMEFTPVAPVKDLVKDRSAKPDFPTLAPGLDDVFTAGARPPADARWYPIAVPGAWEQVAGIDYNGAGWYRMRFEAPHGFNPAAQRMWLEFDAVATCAACWLNDTYIGGHVGDYSRWRLELTDTIKPSGPGELNNELLVYVDELPGHVTQGFLSMIAPHHGGIWQDARIYVTGPVSVLPDGVDIRTDWQTGGVEVTVSTNDPDLASGQTPIWIGISDDEGLVDVDQVRAGQPGIIVDEAAGTLTYATSIDNFELWSPEHPKLYEVEVSVGPGCGMEVSDDAGPCDMVRQKFAFRDIRTEGSSLLLNGKLVNFRSALNWGFYPRIVAPAPPPEVVRSEFAEIKKLGFNAETICLTILPDYYYDIADEMGILLWQEYPTWHATFDAKDRETYLREFERYFRRDSNHPSIVLRSMSCEAGVAQDNVMPELYAMCKDMTRTPSQDNTSWMWLSNPELSDWYDEHNYYTDAQWEKYICETLPAELDQRPPKPFLIGESILASTWPDTDALLDLMGAGFDLVPTEFDPNVLVLTPSGKDDALEQQGLRGTDQPSSAEMAPRGPWPYWAPRCMTSVMEWEGKLRARYNGILPEGEDIVRNYLMPQSYQYALDFRRFQIGLMRMDPRYTGYTVNVVRDMPLIRAGLLDDLGRPRWTPEQWSWHSEQTSSPVAPGDTPDARFEKLSRWDHAWDTEIDRNTHIRVLGEGYRDIAAYFKNWPNAHVFNPAEIAALINPSIAPADLAYEHAVVATSVLTNDLVDYMDRGGVVLLFAGKWPGAFSTVQHMYWRDQPFAPPTGAFDGAGNRLLALQPYDLTHDYSQVVPVDDLDITAEVDPMLRLFDSHDMPDIAVFDQVFATKVGGGMLVVTSLDHSHAAGQWVLSKLVQFCEQWGGKRNDMVATVMNDPSQLNAFYPATFMSAERLKQFAVARVNGIMGLEDGWRFALDPQQQGEATGWARPEFDASAWAPIQVGGWEGQGYDYDGMAWYRIDMDAPADWDGATLRLIADGVDDAYSVWVNGEKVATHGSFTDHEQTVWLKQTVTDLTGKLIPGQRNTLALQVVDITGQGGVWKPVYIAAE